jgi:hypothetical protein
MAALLARALELPRPTPMRSATTTGTPSSAVDHFDDVPADAGAINALADAGIVVAAMPGSTARPGA